MSKEQEYKERLAGYSAESLSQVLADLREVRDWLQKQQDAATDWMVAFDYRERRKAADRKISWTADLLAKAYAKEQN